MFGPEGKNKILDFGLAKALAEEAPVDDSSQSPTLTKGTALGAIMGTAAYMSPEQARGRPVDKRTDIWAFGCCLYEALTGRKAFSGETVTDTLAAIVKNEPDWNGLPDGTPVKIRELVRRCLRKDKSVRLHDVADARIEIGEAIDAPDVEWQVETPTKKGSLPVALSALVGILIGIILGAWLWSRLESQPVDTGSPSIVTRSVIELPPETPLALGGSGKIGFDSVVIAISPDGTQLVYVGSSAKGNRLYRRGLDSFEVEPIPGTEGAIFPYFSPDGRWVGFLTNDKVKKVSLQGGSPVTLCDARTPVRADWIREDVIYFTEDQSGTLSRVPAAGGQPIQIANLSQRGMFLQVLPDGRSALISSFMQSGISGDYESVRLFSIETHEVKTLIKSGYAPIYVPSGHLLFARSGNILAVPFDSERLEVRGEPVAVVSGISMDSFFGQAQITLSENGLLAYLPGGDGAMGGLAWVDRRGSAEFLPVPERLYGVFDLAPGGKRLAVHVGDVNDYIWVYDIPRQEGRKLAATGKAGWPVWMPDAKTVSYASWRPGEERKIRRQEFDAPGSEEELFSSPPLGTVLSWSPDGRTVVFTEFGSGEIQQIRFLTIDEGGNTDWRSKVGSNVFSADFSPDGHWVAYASDETGRYEVFLQSFPTGETVRQVSVDGGIEPVWCWDCGELFYRWGNQWFSTRVTLQPELSWEPPRLAFETDFVDTIGRSYDVSPDGQRLLVVKRTREPIRTKIHIVHNFFEELERLVPTRN